MRRYAIYAGGSNYTDITLNVYKSPNGKVVMTSFDRYNVNLRSYQQNPWMVNFAGAPVWSQSGRSGRNIIPGSNSFCPAVSQIGSLMAVAYAAPTSREGLIFHSLLGLYDNTSFVVWPQCYFEDEWRVCQETSVGEPGDGGDDSGSREYSVHKLERKSEEEGEGVGVGETSKAACWWIARREQSYLGLLCSHPTTEEVGMTGQPALHMRPLPPSSCEEAKLEEAQEKKGRRENVKDVEDTLAKSEAEVEGTDWEAVRAAHLLQNTTHHVPRQRVCTSANHTWVVCVGDTGEYPDVSAFIQHCTQRVSLQQHCEGGVYRAVVSVTDASSTARDDATGESSLSTSINVEVVK